MNNTGVEITAGLGGFLVVFALALTVWLLSRDLSRRLRRMRLREQERLEQIQKEKGLQEQSAQRARQDAQPAREQDEPDPLA